MVFYNNKYRPYRYQFSAMHNGSISGMLQSQRDQFYYKQEMLLLSNNIRRVKTPLCHRPSGTPPH